MSDEQRSQTGKGLQPEGSAFPGIRRSRIFPSKLIPIIRCQVFRGPLKPNALLKRARFTVKLPKKLAPSFLLRKLFR